MHKRYKITMMICWVAVMLLFISQSAFAQTTGKINGRITDAETKQPLFGANVVLQGTSLGAATDANGDFYIINIPPGLYTVEIRMMGYQSVIVENVKLSVNRSSTVDAVMQAAVLEGEAVVVSAQKVAIKKDQTSSIKNVSSEEIAILPVESMNEVIEMQAGVIGGYFRGGRKNEVSYLIDGMQVDEVFNGEESNITLEKEVVQDLEVITGTFNAEYGKAMSGIVNMITRDPGNSFHGSASASFGNYTTQHDDIFIGLDQADFLRKKDFKAQFEGPIVKDYVSFLVNVRHVNDQGHLNGIRRFNVDDYSNFQEPDLLAGQYSPWNTEVKGNQYYSEATGDGDFVPLNFSIRKSYFAKLSIKPWKNIRLALLFSNNEKEEISNYQHSYKYNPDAVLRNYHESELVSLHMNHLLNSKAFYDFKLSYTDNRYGYYRYEDPLDLRYLNVNYGLSAGGFSSGGIDKSHTEQYTTQYMAKFDFVWQVNKNHSVKTGVQYTDYRIENRPSYVRDAAWGTPEETAFYYDPEQEKMIFKTWEPELYPLESIEMDRYVKKPFDAAFYIQDKMEYDALVINYGVRYDYFNSNTIYPSNRRNPANQGAYDDPTFMSTYPKAEPQVQWSPRLGLSYTLGQSAVLHFSYGHFFQMPPFYSLYSNHRFLVPFNNFGTEHGNPEINSQKTVKYEMGLWQEVMPGLGVEVSVYYSDIYDLLTAVVWTTYNQIQYAAYDNKDYANTKGLEVKLDWQTGPLVTGVNYTLQYTRGNADNPRSTYNRLAQNQDPIPTLIPLSWDQRHTLNVNVGLERRQYALSTTFFFNSGFPYTLEPILESRLAKQNLLPNTTKRPASFRVDLQGHYDIALSNRYKLRCFLYVKNVFDQLNEIQVYGSTGRAYTTILGNVAEDTFRSNYNDVYDQFENPGMYARPREIKLGLGFMF